MDQLQELLKMIAEVGRLQSGLDAASDLEREFARRVKAMLAGTEKPVTPEEAENFSRAIADANVREPGERTRLVAKLLEINEFAQKHLGTVGAQAVLDP
jgi:hypothetical protein